MFSNLLNTSFQDKLVDFKILRFQYLKFFKHSIGCHWYCWELERFRSGNAFKTITQARIHMLLVMKISALQISHEDPITEDSLDR